MGCAVEFIINKIQPVTTFSNFFQTFSLQPGRARGKIEKMFQKYASKGLTKINS